MKDETAGHATIGDRDYELHIDDREGFRLLVDIGRPGVVALIRILGENTATAHIRQLSYDPGTRQLTVQLALADRDADLDLQEILAEMGWLSSPAETTTEGTG
jgi:hypothetical protein